MKSVFIEEDMPAFVVVLENLFEDPHTFGCYARPTSGSRGMRRGSRRREEKVNVSLGSHAAIAKFSGGWVRAAAVDYIRRSAL